MDIDQKMKKSLGELVTRYENETGRNMVLLYATSGDDIKVGVSGWNNMSDSPQQDTKKLLEVSFLMMKNFYEAFDID